MKNASRKKSIFTDDLGKCWVCGTHLNIHKHEIYPGDNRKKSIEHGFIVGLCGKHHNQSSQGVHYDQDLKEELQKECQRKFELEHSRCEFMEIIGKNYLWEE